MFCKLVSLIPFRRSQKSEKQLKNTPMVHMMSNIKVTLQRGLGQSRKKEDVELASRELVGIQLGT